MTISMSGAASSMVSTLLTNDIDDAIVIGKMTLYSSDVLRKPVFYK